MPSYTNSVQRWPTVRLNRASSRSTVTFSSSRCASISAIAPGAS